MTQTAARRGDKLNNRVCSSIPRPLVSARLFKVQISRPLGPRQITARTTQEQVNGAEELPDRLAVRVGSVAPINVLAMYRAGGALTEKMTPRGRALGH